MNRHLIAFLTIPSFISGLPVYAQVPPSIPPPVVPRTAPPPEIQPPLPTPSPLNETEPATPSPESPEVQDTITVSRFRYQGNTVFSNQELDAITAPYIGRKITFTELRQVRSAITRLYVDRGYVTSAAYIPLQGNEAIAEQGGIVTIQVIEGRVERIDVTGSDRLTDYVRSRLGVSQDSVLNEKNLLESLRLLQIDPLVRSISGNLEAGSQVGLSILSIRVEAAPTFRATLDLNSNRSPTVGIFERRIGLEQANLLGFGDELQLGYANTDGSNQVDVSYQIPINPQNGSLSFRYSTLVSQVIEEPFKRLDIRANSRIYEFTFRQPIVRTATAETFQEFAIGITAARLESETSLLGINFPLSSGADENGATRISVLRAFQEYVQRSNRQVLLLRSQFSFGLDALGATLNPAPPDSQFFAWRGQAAFLQRLGDRTYLVFRADLQVADRPLVPLEQFSLGGVSTVRGYRQDTLLGDNGVLGSVEFHLPVVATPFMELQLIPFFDVGHVWSHNRLLERNTLAALGLGVQWTWENLNVNLSYGIPLIPVPRIGNTLQENSFNAAAVYRWSF